MEIVYSAQKSGFVQGRSYQNPRFFEGKPFEGATSIIVVGDWPNIVAVYEEAKIPVKVVATNQPLPDPTEPAKGRRVRSELPKDDEDDEKDDDDDKDNDDDENVPLDKLTYRQARARVKQIDPDFRVTNLKQALEFLKRQ